MSKLCVVVLIHIGNSIILTSSRVCYSLCDEHLMMVSEIDPSQWDLRVTCLQHAYSTFTLYKDSVM